MRESIDSTRLGANRTGLQMSPMHSKEMIENVDAVAADPTESQALAETRREYILEADALGSIPAPATVKGMAKSGAKMLTGNRPQVFIDKLAERLAFERGGARLYDAVLVKFMAHAAELKGVTIEDVQEIRDDEASHALLIKECIEKLGADPTAQTPCADLVGVETMGLLQVASDPRTTLAQTLHAALSAELVDLDGWETLIALAENMGQDEMAELFREALRDEGQHLAKVRSWFKALTLETSELV
ncbi:MAG: ferritin-like domain-containing protein [Steroidobacter sp.]